MDGRGTAGHDHLGEAALPAHRGAVAQPARRASGGFPRAAFVARPRRPCAALRGAAAILAVATWVAGAAAILALAAGVAEAAALVFATSAPGAPAACDCERFASDLAEAQALFASRGDGVEIPVTGAMREVFRKRVDATYARARCLADCDTVAERERNAARVLLAFAALKNTGLPDAGATERIAVAVAATERCLDVDPANRDCHLWHASARGTLARDSWNPLNLRLPGQLLAEFRAARAGAPPGHDLLDGTATRAEVSLLLRAPVITGRDPAAARRLIEEAKTAPRFTCAIANRLLLATVRQRTGTPELALAELRAAVAAGLPSCGLQRYENAVALEETSRCLARLEVEPAADPNWDDDCR